MTGQSKTKIVQGSDGVWRHPSGRAASREFHRLLDAGAALTASAARRTDPPYLAGLIKGWRAASAGKKLKAARVQLAADVLGKARRDDVVGRASRARQAITAANRQARNISIRETANWCKR